MTDTARSETFQWFSAEAEEAIRKAIEPQPVSHWSREPGYSSPDGGESYSCEDCPAEFGFQPEGFRCPICGRGLTGTVTINFYPPQPPDEDDEPVHVPSDPGARCN